MADGFLLFFSDFPEGLVTRDRGGLLERLHQLFECNSIAWLKPRMLLIEVRWLILCGQLAKAQVFLALFFSQTDHRPIDRWNAHSLSLMLDRRRGNRSKALFLDDENVVSGLTAFEHCHRNVLLAQRSAKRSKIEQIANFCVDAHFEALLPDKDLLKPHTDDVQVFPIERRISYKGNVKRFRSNGRSFDLLLVLIQNSHRIFSKKELINLVWQRTNYDPLTDDNVLYVNITSLRKHFHKDCIVSTGGGFRWNPDGPFVVLNVPA